MQKSNSLQARPNRGSPITFNESKKLLEDIEHSRITLEEALKRINNIRSDIERFINQKSINETRLK